jgi:hypothetical protein
LPSETRKNISLFMRMDGRDPKSYLRFVDEQSEKPIIATDEDPFLWHK